MCCWTCSGLRGWLVPFPLLQAARSQPTRKSLRFRKQQTEKLIWQSSLYFHSARYQESKGADSSLRPVDSPACRRHVHALQLVVFLPFHPAVLKPDFDLSLWEAQGMGYLDPPPARQVAVEMELLLQLQGLVPCVCSPGSLPLRSGKFL